MSSEEKYDAKTFKMYMKAVSEARKQSALAAYFLANYTVNKALEFLNTQRNRGQDDPELGSEVQGWFQVIDDLKRSIPPEELQDRELCRKTYYEYMYSLFLRADNRYRDDDYTPQVAQEFFFATIFFDGYSTFNVSDPELVTHKKYAKVARLKIMKAIKSGNIPVPKTRPQQQNPDSQTDIPDDSAGAGVKKMNDFQPHQSIINRQQQSQGNNNPYNNPYYQAPGNDNFGQGGLPDFGKFDNHASVKPTNEGLADFLKFGDAGTAQAGNNLNFGGNVGGGMNIEPSNNYGFGGQNKGGHGGPKVRRSVDFYKKTAKAQDICKKALSELEYKRIRQFKENLETALEMLESLGDQ